MISATRALMLGLFASTMLLLSCASSRYSSLLAEHREMLKHAAYDQLGLEETTDIFLTSLTTMMGESLEISNPDKGADFATKYFDQNQKEIDLVLEKMKGYGQDQSLKGSIKQLMKLRSKPYASDAIKLTPKFLERYKDYEFVTDAASRIKEEVGFMAADKVLDKVLDKIE